MQPVLLAYDGSESAAHAIREAAKLLAPGPAVVVYAWEPLSRAFLWNPIVGSPGPLADAAAELDTAGSQEAERLAEEGARLAGEAGFQAEPVAVEAVHGAAQAILRVADERSVRTVVLGSPGRSLLGRGPGGVAARVVQQSSRPVLVVPPAGDVPAA